MPHSYMKEEMYLVRWLRARDYNIPEAANFLLQNIQWRKEHNMDGIFDEDWSDMARDYKYHIESRDRAGQPLAYLSVDEIDIRKAIVNGKGDRLLRFVDRAFEEVTQLVNDLGNKYKNITRAQFIVNLSGYNLVEHGCLRCIPAILRAVLSYEAHFPEYVDHLMIINTPTIAEPLLNAVRPLLGPSTRRSFKVYGINKKTNMEILDGIFEKDQIPVNLGGRKRYRGQSLDYDDY
ncbi:SEC14-like protein 1 isoform X2 [Folsomia candida]|nr:SEC14-like protein 1 isoform X2 [Folsomia candida]